MFFSITSQKPFSAFLPFLHASRSLLVRHSRYLLRPRLNYGLFVWSPSVVVVNHGDPLTLAVFFVNRTMTSPSPPVLFFASLAAARAHQSPDLLQQWLESGDKQTSSVFPLATVPLDPQRAWTLRKSSILHCSWNQILASFDKQQRLRF
ncbi:hypothetical protein MRB53_021343 [Persea americana]|uniref:Uncharacterized protein n=1 Tax=Persea americana TaxID=3435 RepID=A0ACC2L3R1_PERAE|nr:hypothetical protein MRB53_021343 [Persea americana]